MHYRSATAILLTSILVLAGCIGDDGEEEEVDDTTRDTDDTRGNRTTTPTRNMTTNRTNETDTSPTNTTGNQTTTQNQTEVEEETRTGTAESLNLIIRSDETEEAYDVATGASLFEIEISITGDDTAICITAPEGEDCEEELDAEEGTNVTFSASKPAAGEWIVGLTPQGLGSAESEYSITFRVTTASNGTGNGTGGPSPTGGTAGNTTAASPTTTATTGTTRR